MRVIGSDFQPFGRCCKMGLHFEVLKLTQNSGQGFWSTINALANNAVTWFGLAPVISAGFTWVAKQSKVLGELNWADAWLVATTLTSIFLLAVACSLAAWRRFSPDRAEQADKQMIVLGVRAAIVNYHENCGLSVPQYLDRDASFMRMRRHLPKTLLEEFRGSGRTIYVTDDSRDLHPLLQKLMDEADILAAKWNVG